ncbi:hypothetical protein GF351_00310, partial [Candidatus Woesearchaeota archaeon]|nr:hypothetical protein [Candidatus Woesearchaeota archaeon]
MEKRELSHLMSADPEDFAKRFKSLDAAIKACHMLIHHKSDIVQAIPLAFQLYLYKQAREGDGYHEAIKYFEKAIEREFGSLNRDDEKIPGRIREFRIAIGKTLIRLGETKEALRYLYDSKNNQYYVDGSELTGIPLDEILAQGELFARKRPNNHGKISAGLPDEEPVLREELESMIQNFPEFRTYRSV